MARRILTLVLCITLAGFAACKSAPKEGEEENLTAQTAGADEAQMGDSDSGKAMGLKTVNFPYDSFSLEGSTLQSLKDNAAILNSNSTLNVQIEGHCDQRGGIQYNIALGEKRANAVKKYLVGQGIAETRLSTISYGKERPADQNTSEEAYAKNRRANFAITSK